MFFAGQGWEGLPSAFSRRPDEGIPFRGNAGRPEGLQAIEDLKGAEWEGYRLTVVEARPRVPSFAREIKEEQCRS